jgi:hypothetical protein
VARRRLKAGPLGLISDIDNPPPSLAPSLIESAESYLKVPGGLAAGTDLRLTDEQFELLWVWYSVTPNGRRYVFNRRLILRMAKGWAKSPIGAIDAFSNLVGDVVPDGLDAYGRPVGRPHPAPWYQVAATALDQTDNLFMQLYHMLRESPAIDDLSLDVGLTRIRKWDALGEGIEPVTAEAGSREGQPITGAALEETHLWTPTNGGVKLARTINRNATKAGGGFARTLELTNAYLPGAGSVAERSEAAIAGGRGSGVLLVAREADMPKPIEQMRDAVWVRQQLAKVYGSAAQDAGGWTDLDRITQDVVEAADDELRTQARFFFNLVMADDADGFDHTRWAALARPGARLVKGDVVGLGFDGSDVGDATALYACRWPDWTVFRLKVWERPLDESGVPVKGAWRVPRAEVKAEVRAACRLYKVVRGYADDSGWQSEIDELTGEVGQSFMRFPHRQDQRIGPACERWSTMVGEGTLGHDGDPVLPRHAANVRRVHIGRPESKWWRPARKLDALPIDAFSAAVSAVHALADAVAHGEVTGAAKPATVNSTVAAGAGAGPTGSRADRELWRPGDRLRI